MHTTQKDTTYTKIFVGGLPYHTTDSSLRKYFEVFGEIEEAVVITDRQTGKSRGYGFVSMKLEAVKRKLWNKHADTTHLNGNSSDNKAEKCFIIKRAYA